MSDALHQIPGCLRASEKLVDVTPLPVREAGFVSDLADQIGRQRNAAQTVDQGKYSLKFAHALPDLRHGKPEAYIFVTYVPHREAGEVFRADQAVGAGQDEAHQDQSELATAVVTVLDPKTQAESVSYLRSVNAEVGSEQLGPEPAGPDFPLGSPRLARLNKDLLGNFIDCSVGNQIVRAGVDVEALPVTVVITDLNGLIRDLAASYAHGGNSHLRKG